MKHLIHFFGINNKLKILKCLDIKYEKNEEIKNKKTTKANTIKI